MLPPVRTISGSSGSYQNSSSVTASAHLTGEPIFPGQAADADRDVNPNLAGKLNILLMSGRDVVAEDISMLADALGRVIDLPREPGETSAVYVHRLAEALTALTGNARAEAERQLNQMIRGIRLDFVIKAFLNPTGPEAARIVALIEMAGLRDADFATRTVLTSYRQNGADIPLDLPMQGPPQRNGTLPATAAGLAAAASALPDASGARPASSASGSPLPSLAGEMPIILAEEFEDEPELVIFHSDTDNIFSRTSSEPLKSESRSAASGAYAVLEEARTASVRSPMDKQVPPGPGVDARRLQTILDRAFEAGDNADPVIQAKAAMELLASEDAPPQRPLAGNRPASRLDEPLVKPFIDYTRPPAQVELHNAILTVKGWTEGDGGRLPILPASMEAEAALSAALSPHAGPEPDVPESLYALRGRGIAANDDRHKSALAAAEQQLLRTADEAAGLAADRRLDPSAPSLQGLARASAGDALIAAALQLGHDPRAATGYATVPYPVADERDEERADRSGYRSQSEGEEAEGEGEEERHAEQEQTASPDLAEEPAVAASPDVPSDHSDPAFDLYQRMAGWN